MAVVVQQPQRVAAQSEEDWKLTEQKLQVLHHLVPLSLSLSLSSSLSSSPLRLLSPSVHATHTYPSGSASTSTPITAATKEEREIASAIASNFSGFTVNITGQIESCEMPYDNLYCKFAFVFGADWSVVAVREMLQTSHQEPNRIHHHNNQQQNNNNNKTTKRIENHMHLFYVCAGGATRLEPVQQKERAREQSRMRLEFSSRCHAAEHKCLWLASSGKKFFLVH